MMPATAPLTPTPAPTAAVQPSAPSATALDEAQKTAACSTQGQKDTRNAQILEASLQVSIQAGNDSMTLLYRTAIDGINAALESELGPDAIQNAMSQDNSAEATAGRIVALSTAMFDAYAARYPDKDMAEVAKDFIHVIRGGFEQGYQEAEDILNSLGVLPDVKEVAEGIAKTFELVHKGYDDWLNNKLTAMQGPAEAVAEEA
ncbi:MAG TPA: DUF5610 domain-containing protein [Comamonas sp.]